MHMYVFAYMCLHACVYTHTRMCVSAVATNGKVGGGGAYYMVPLLN
jgi:hypothetical protein